MSEWQPIETAPSSHKSMLIYCDERKNTYICYWSSMNNTWTVMGGWRLTDNPTHWMPLPEPPKGVSDEQ